MEITLKVISLIFLIYFVSISMAQDTKVITTIDEYNQELPIWGTSWTPGRGHINGYYPSFYTGFAPRNQNPNRIHIRTSRGNQTRVSSILDTNTIIDYLYDLEKRYEFYEQMMTPPQGVRAAVNPNPAKSKLVQQVQHYFDIFDSPIYQIRDILNGNPTSESFYSQSLHALKQLNPGRVFMINLDLNSEFMRWQKNIVKLLGGKAASEVFTQNSQATVIAINSLVWGRINYTKTPSAMIIQTLQQAATAAQNNNLSVMKPIALELFSLLSEGKYDFKVLDEQGQWRKAVVCNAKSCTLSYPELTTIYPTGSIKSSTKDKFGNRIAVFATPGLWPFLDRSYHEVDHIRKESYYGWAPKMDFEGIGNGFHNPAVRFAGSKFPESVKKALGTSLNHTTLWTVMRGGVSSGCLRLPLGHIWELRHLMPVENNKMKQVYQFGNNSSDFDLYDIDGNGTLEVMGVEYQISYNLQGASGLDKREGADLNISKDSKVKFYNRLYGKKNVFYTDSSDNYIFTDPSVSFPSHLNLRVKKTKTSYTLDGSYPLYEQAYERDKIQFYLPKTTQELGNGSRHSLSKRLVRIMGRVRGCAPTSDKNECGENAFESERYSIIKELYGDN